MRISLGDVTLWFDVSGPSVVPRGDTAVERPTLVAVHGGPGLDHINISVTKRRASTRGACCPRSGARC